MYWLSDRFLPAEKSVVTEMGLRTQGQIGAQFHLDCYATEAGLVDQLERQLRDDRHGVDINSIHEDPKQETYHWKFKSEVGLAKVDPETRFAPARAKNRDDKPAPAQTPAAAGKKRGGNAP